MVNICGHLNIYSIVVYLVVVHGGASKSFMARKDQQCKPYVLASNSIGSGRSKKSWLVRDTLNIPR